MALLVVLSCAPPRTRTPAPADDAGAAAIRVLIAPGLTTPEIGSNGGWFLLDAQLRLMARVGANEKWRIERDGDRVRATRGSVRTKIKTLGISIERAVNAEDEGRPGNGDE